MRLLPILLVALLLLGCAEMSDTRSIIAESAIKANSLDAYVIEYERVVVSYLDPNETIYMTPASTITKHKKGGNMRWDTVDWLGDEERLYNIDSGYWRCSLNKTWSCEQEDASAMQEFLGYNVPDPAASVWRQVSGGAILLGAMKEETVLERDCTCFASEIQPELFTDEDWGEFVLGSIDRKSASGMKDLKAWQCLDKQTGMKLELILNYKTEIDMRERTVEVTLNAKDFRPGAMLEDTMFELPAP